MLEICRRISYYLHHTMLKVQVLILHVSTAEKSSCDYSQELNMC
jgi:hypothetical protein